MTPKELFLPNQKRYRHVVAQQELSDEEIAMDWTLSDPDRLEIGQYRKNSRLFIAIQLCAVRLYGRFVAEANHLSPRIISYLNTQLELPPFLTINTPSREATFSEQRKNILSYLGFSKYDDAIQANLQIWLEKQAQQGCLPDDLFQRAEQHLLAEHVVLPGASVLERLVIQVCAETHEPLFDVLYNHLPTEVKYAIDKLLLPHAGSQRSQFYQLKEYPPSAIISSIQSYLERYRLFDKTGIDTIQVSLAPAFVGYLNRLTRRYNAKEIKRFNEPKRYALMVCFLLETRKVLLDQLVKMHDQFIMDMLRKAKQRHEKKHREFRKRQKKAVDRVLESTHVILDWPDDEPFYKADFWQRIDEKKLLESIDDLYIFKRLEERGYGDMLVSRYPSLRKYFAEFIQLPFAANQGRNSYLPPSTSFANWMPEH